MPRGRRKAEPVHIESSRPATSPEARENQLISLAYDLAEKQFREGTASAQVISHFLKLGSTRYSLEREMMESQRDLYAAKAKSIASMENMEGLVGEVVRALRTYQGVDDDVEDPNL